jgi:uncharacterized protein (TIGR02246 family)
MRRYIALDIVARARMTLINTDVQLEEVPGQPSPPNIQSGSRGGNHTPRQRMRPTEDHLMNEDRCAQLWAIEEIKKLKSRYVRFVDEKNWAAWAALFALDCVFVVPHQSRVGLDGTPAVLRGREEIVDAVRRLFSTGVSVHQVFAPDIDIIDDHHATGVWAMTDYIDMSYARKRSYGHYHERYVKVDDQWLFERIQETRLRTDQLPPA